MEKAHRFQIKILLSLLFSRTGRASRRAKPWRPYTNFKPIKGPLLQHDGKI